MGAPQSRSVKKRTLRKVATGLYRSSTSGVYFAHVRIRGKLFRQSLETSDREIATRKLGDFRKKQSRVATNSGRLTIGDLCDRFEQTLGKLSRSSRKAKSGILKRIREDWPQGRGAKLSGIKSSDCEIWLARQARRLSQSHTNAYLTALRDMLRLAVRDRLIAEHPCEHLKYSKRPRPVRHTPSTEEFRAIVESIRGEQYNADAQDSANFVEFIGLAGLGQAEAASMTWGDVDLKRGQLTAFRHKTREGFVIPIYPQLRPLLERLRNGDTPAPQARILKIKDAKKAISGACRRLGLPAYTHRSFRRMFITRAIELGVDVKVIAQWQGHSDGGKLILDTYSHVNPAHSNRMAQLMTAEEK